MAQVFQQDQIGFLELACQAKTVLVEDGSHDLAVTKVHLATITFQVEQTAGSCLFHLLLVNTSPLSVIRQKRFLLVKCWILIIHGANLQRMTVNLTAKHQYLYPCNMDTNDQNYLHISWLILFSGSVLLTLLHLHLPLF